MPGGLFLRHTIPFRFNYSNLRVSIFNNTTIGGFWEDVKVMFFPQFLCLLHDLIILLQKI